MTKDLAFVLRFYGGGAFRRWLDRCYGTTFAHGQELVMLLDGADNVYRAERLLAEAERAGWIKRGEYRPTAEQRFFGVGGSGVGKNGDGLTGYPVCWGWSPTGSDSARAWLAGGEEAGGVSDTAVTRGHDGIR